MQVLFWLSLVLAIKKLQANIPHHISHNGIRSVDGVKPVDFINELFKKYGRNNNGDYIDSSQFDALLKKLGIGRNLTSENAISVKDNVSIVVKFIFALIVRKRVI